MKITVISTACNTDETMDPIKVRISSVKLAKRHMLLYILKNRKITMLFKAQGKMNRA